MDVLFQIFTLITDKAPRFCARMLAYFLRFPFKPYPIAKLTMRTLRENNLTSISLLLFFFTAFAIILGIPNTRRLIIAFSGGLEASLQAVWRLDTKGKEFFYLVVFVFVCTILTVALAELAKWVVRRQIPRRSEFLDMFNIFIAYNIGWFMLASLLVNALFGPAMSVKMANSELIKRIASYFESHNVPNVTDILLQPAVIFPLLTITFISDRLFNTWERRESLVKLISEGKPKEAIAGVAHKSVNVIPWLSFVFILFTSSLVLAFTANALFFQIGGDKKVKFESTCETAGQKLFMGVSVENNTLDSIQLHGLYARIEKS